MPNDEFGDRTEQPTERRRSEMRQKGNVARSIDLNAAGHMLAAAAVMYFLGSTVTRSIAELMHRSLYESGWPTIDCGLASRKFWDIAEWAVVGVLPLMLAMLATALVINISQVGFLIAPESIQPKLARLNPIEGVKRILSIQGLVRLSFSLAKLILLVAIAAWFFVAQLPGFLAMIVTEPGAILLGIGESIVNLAFLLALALIVLGFADFSFQKWKHERDLRMTKQEVREELKNMEGDSLIRHRRRDAHRKLAQAQELQRVQDADVVITTPTHIAVAIKYDPETMSAPIVVAKGMGEITERIQRIAAEHSVPIIERKELAQVLHGTVRVGQAIPVDLYEVFVEIMAYVYRIAGRTPPNFVV